MVLFIPILVIVIIISFILGRKVQNKIVSDSSPFSFADDVLIINAGTVFSVPSSSIECVELQYNPKALQNRSYAMGIHIVKTDGSGKKFRYSGSRNGTQPQDMATALMAHRIPCVVKDS